MYGQTRSPQAFGHLGILADQIAGPSSRWCVNSPAVRCGRDPSRFHVSRLQIDGAEGGLRPRRFARSRWPCNDLSPVIEV